MNFSFFDPKFRIKKVSRRTNKIIWSFKGYVQMGKSRSIDWDWSKIELETGN